MSSSDWLQIILTLIGFFGGLFISWVFFRAQQTTDFNSLRELIGKISRDIASKDRLISDKLTDFEKSLNKFDNEIVDDMIRMAGARELTGLNKRLDSLQDFTSIKVTLEVIDEKLSEAVKSIISELKEQQKTLSIALQEKFDEQWRRALPAIESSLRQELSKYIPTSKEQNDVIEKLKKLVGQEINNIGEYQRKNFEDQILLVFTKVQSDLQGTVSDAAQTVKGLEKKIDDFLIALPNPSQLKESIESKEAERKRESKKRIEAIKEILMSTGNQELDELNKNQDKNLKD